MAYRPLHGAVGKETEPMIIRKTQFSDIDDIMSIYESARAFMRLSGNGKQWGSGYPTRAIVENDITSENGYVVVDEGEIIGAFFFKIGTDPTYIKIYDGQWINDEKYGVIHRIAVKYQGRRIASFIYNYCLGIINNIKIDTHKDNTPMQKSLLKNGFKYCGIIHLENGDERIAYQKVE